MGFTPFWAAVETNKVKFIELFVRHGFNGTNTSTRLGHTPYHLAAEIGNINILEKLIEVGSASVIDVDALDIFGQSALQFAVHGGHIEIVNHLAQMGAEVNRVNTLILPPICAAAKVGCIEMTSRLLHLGADLETIDRDEGMTPLITAAAFRNTKNFPKSVRPQG